MRVAHGVTAIAVVASSAIAVAQNRSAFHFQIPAGWTDLANDRSVAVDGFAPALVAAARSGRFAVFAVGRTERGTLDSMNVITRDGGGAVTAEAMAEIARGLPTGIVRSSPGASVRVLEAGLVEIGGVPSGRIVFDEATPEFHLRMLQVVVTRGGPQPGRGQTATITFSTTADRFDAMRARFEATAAATTGASPPPPWWTRVLDAHAMVRDAAFGAVAGALLGVSALVARRRKRR